MQVPKDVALPPEGKWLCWTRSNWGSGRYGIWYVVDHTGRVVTCGYLHKVAEKVGRHNFGT